MPRVGIATVSRIAAEAGARVADDGGNAVDAAIAAGLVATITHPGMCSLGGGGFVTIGPPEGSPVSVDGALEMPGRGRPPERFGRGDIPVHIEYADGVDTVVGPGSVATPGAVAACGLAVERFGRRPWAAVLEPAVERAELGFPLPASSYEYLSFAHRAIFGWHEESAAALHDARGDLKPEGSTLHLDGLADTLRTLAADGPEAFYRGALARRIAAAVEEGDGLLGEEDLAAYRARVRPALEVSLDAWQLATNPPPAVGGVALAAMLLLMGDRPHGAWTPADLERLVEAQTAVLAYRRRRLDGSEERETEADRLLHQARAGRLGAAEPGADGGASPGAGEGLPGLASPSTLHTSAVDSDGLACAVTLSDGYGSGLMPPGTGFWLNNCLGEAELNGRGYHGWTPGSRLPSNMAPTVGRTDDGSVLAIGSPGADRITTAILQTLLAFVRLGLPLEAAVRHPRLHVERAGAGSRIVHESGLAVESLDMPTRRYERPSMFFGGVEAAVLRADGGFELAADPRRTGGTAVGGG